MKNNHPEAIVNAILEPDPQAREELERKRVAERRSLAMSRFTAAFVLAGFAVGVPLAHFMGERWSTGGLWGGIFGAIARQFIGAWYWRRRST